MKYQKTDDPGHGWLHVERAELKRLGIADKISGYSYQRGSMVYLEEDCDASRFIDAKAAIGEPVEYETRHCNSTPIRGYASYSPTPADMGPPQGPAPKTLDLFGGAP